MRRNQTRLALAVCGALLSVSMSACGGGGDSPTTNTNTNTAAPELTIPQKIAQLEDAGALPKLDRSADIKGPDADNNGIRDDIDAIIQKTYTEPAQRKAAVQFAAVLQSQLQVDPNNKAAVKALSVRSARHQLPGHPVWHHGQPELLGRSRVAGSLHGRHQGPQTRPAGLLEGPGWHRHLAAGGQYL